MPLQISRISTLRLSLAAVVMMTSCRRAQEQATGHGIGRIESGSRDLGRIPLRWRGTLSDARLDAISKMLSGQTQNNEQVKDCLGHLRSIPPEGLQELSGDDEGRAIAIAGDSLAIAKVEGVNVRIGRNCEMIQVSVFDQGWSAWSIYLWRMRQGNWTVFLKTHVEY